MRFAVLLCAVGCWSHNKPAPIGNQVSEPRPTASSMYAATIADPLGFLPLDAGIVFRVDADRIRGSALWARFGDGMMAKASETLTARQQCYKELLSGLTSFTMSIRSVQPVSGVGVIRGVDGKRGLACMASKPNDETTIEVVGDTYIWRQAQGETAMRLVGDSTVVFVVEDRVVPATLDKVIASGAPLRKSPGFMSFYDAIVEEQAVWFVVGSSSSVLTPLKDVLNQIPRAVFGTLDVKDYLGATVRVRLSDSTVTSNAVAMVQQHLHSLKMFLDRVDVKADDVDMVFEVQASEANLTQLLGVAGLAIP